MFVLKKIGLIKIGRVSHRFNLNEKIPKVVLEHLEETNQLDALRKAGIIGDDKPIGEKKAASVTGEKKDEPLRPEQSGQPEDTNQNGRLDIGNDGNKPGPSSKPSNKRSHN